MQLRQLSTVIVVLVGLLFSSLSIALGLGDVTLKSSYNEPLNAEIRVLQPQELSKSEIFVRLASNEDFERVGLERDFFLTGLKFDVVLDDPANAHIKVTSRVPVQEPYLNFLVDMQWPSGRLLREYTLLLDLPVFDNSASPTAVVDVPDVQPAIPEPVKPAPATTQRAVQESLSPSRPRSTASTNIPDRELSSRSAPPSTFSSTSEAADDFIKQLSQEAAERKSSFSVEPSPSPRNTRNVSVVENEVSSNTSAVAPVSRQLTPSSEPGIAPETQVTRPDSITVGDGDTLWALALKMRPNKSVSVQQTMLAIQQSNPDAFIGNNINRLRKGQVLRAPTLSDIQKTSSRDAVAAVKQQTEVWKQQTQQKAVLSAVSPDLNPLPQSTQQEGRVTLGSATSSNTSGTVGANGQQGVNESLQNELAIAEEELDRASRENTNLKDKIDELEKQIQTLEQIVSVTSTQLKALETVSKSTETPVAQNTENSVSENENTSAEPVIDNTGSANPATAQASPEESIAQEPTPNNDFTQRQSITNVIADNLLYIAIALLVIILLVLFLLRKHSEDSEEDMPYDDTDFIPLDEGLEDYEDDALEDGVLDDGELGVVSDNSVSELDSEELSVEPQTDDVLAEAAIYTGLGQFEKAEKLLHTEIQQNPDNAQARLALLDVYVKSDNIESFDDQYAQLLPLGDEPANKQAQLMRQSFTAADDFDVDNYSPESGELEEQLEKTLEEQDDLEALSELDDDFLTELNDNEANDSDRSLESEEISEEVGELFSSELDDELLVEPTEQSDQELLASSSSDDLSLDNELFALDFDAELSDSDNLELASLDDALNESPSTEGTRATNHTEDDRSEEAFDFEEFNLDDSDSLDLDLDDELLSDLDASLDADDLDNVSLELDNEAGDVADTASGDVSLTESQLDDLLDASEALDDLSSQSSLSETDNELDLDLLDLNEDLEDLDNELEKAVSLEDDQNEQFNELSAQDLESESKTESDEVASDLELNPLSNDDSDITEFDLDSPPDDIDMASLDQELDEMSALFDEELPNENALETETETETEIANSLSSEDGDSQEADLPVDIKGIDDLDDEFESSEGEVDTKLDLAQAYIDMGDLEGAEDLLNEVMEEGDDNQKSAAEKLFQDIQST